MDFFSLITDPKIILIIVAVVLLIGLAYYGWKQLTELRTNNEKMAEQVKHGLILSDKKVNPGIKLKLRPDMASNMSEETYPEGPEEDENEWNEGHPDTEDEDEDGDGDISNDEHDAYIQELIRIQDSKRSPDFYIKDHQQPGHNGPVYESEEEEVIFDNYDDAEDEDEVSESDLIAHAAAELAAVPVIEPARAAPVPVAPAAVAPIAVAPVAVEPPVPQVVVAKSDALVPASEKPKPFIEKINLNLKPKPVIKGKVKAN